MSPVKQYDAWFRGFCHHQNSLIHNNDAILLYFNLTIVQFYSRQVRTDLKWCGTFMVTIILHMCEPEFLNKKHANVNTIQISVVCISLLLVYCCYKNS